MISRSDYKLLSYFEQQWLNIQKREIAVKKKTQKSSLAPFRKVGDLGFRSFQAAPFQGTRIKF
jgi:hypothetical protein